MIVKCFFLQEYRCVSSKYQRIGLYQVELKFEVRVLLLLYILVLLTLLLTRIPVFVRLYLVYTGSALVSSFSRGELH